MEDFGALMHGFSVVLSWNNMGLMLVGILLGIVVGVLPGLGGPKLPGLGGFNPFGKKK